VNKTDSQLLEEYCCGAEEAFTQLVRRHVDLVYATAMRRTSDPGLAEDVTQAVFIVLEKKARTLRERVTLAGWLFVVTRHVAKAAMRAKIRRLKHERLAARGEAVNMTADDHSQMAEVSRVLDDALAGLRGGDRDAITLRFLEENTFVEVGEVLGISEEAARKRVDRGISRLRKMLARHSIFLEAEALSLVIAKFAAKPAPSFVTENILTAQTTKRAVSLYNEVLRMFLFRQVSAVTLVALLIFCGFAVITTMAQAKSSGSGAKAVSASIRPALNVQRMIIQMGVKNLAANIDLFEKLDFHLAAQDANHPIQWATMENGVVRVRLIATKHISPTGENLAPLFYIDGGYPALKAMHDDLVSRHLHVNKMDLGTTPRPAVEMRDGHLTHAPADGGKVIQFTVNTPDGHQIGFVALMNED
jgi:RNA polymerase sigma factor (sigma-70 family)